MESAPEIEKGSLDIKKGEQLEENSYILSTRTKQVFGGLIFFFLLLIPYVFNFETSHMENSEEILEDFLKNVDKEIIGKTIYGATISESTGQLPPGKNCAVFYTEDPEKNLQAIATRVCPDLWDNQISFHIKGVFATHPNNTNPESDSNQGMQVNVVSTGTYVWTTFFDQHNSTSQTFAIPPGISADISYITNGHVAEFYRDIDAVKITHTDTFVVKTRGLQPLFPECATFYEAINIDHKTKGFMICRSTKHRKEMLFSRDYLTTLGINPQNADTNGLSFIATGAKVKVVAYLGPNFDFDHLEVVPDSTCDLTKTLRTDGSNLSWNKKPKSFKLVFAKG